MDREALDQTSRVITTMAIKVHSKLGPGFLESIYRTCLIHELRNAERLLPVHVVPRLVQGLKRVVNRF